MKTLYKSLTCTAAGTALCLFLAFPANAQRTTSSGGGGNVHSSGSSSGGGGSRSSGGSSVSSSRPSGGGGASFNRSSGGSRANFNRPSGGSYGGRSAAGVQRSPGAQSPNYVYHNGAIVRNNAGQRQGIYAPNRGGSAANAGVGVRGNSGYSQRSGVTSYRSMPQVGHGSGYWGTHGYYHYNHGYYNTYYATRLGYTCSALSFGYYPFFWGDSQYYFSDGLFYTYDNDEYTVVDPPVGAEITALPQNAQSIVINGEQYYECNGVYYQPVTKDDGTVVYMVAGKDGVLNTDSQVQDDQQQAPQIGDVVTELPSDCNKIKLNGEILYVSPDGIYYKEMIDANGNKTYKIVGLPSDESDGN
jgi:hypothetical protein